MEDGEVRPWVKEIILENFMSYKYSRIPLSRGINVVCGPNGAGKSSILLGLSVALGQTYTERSKSLKDLIRRGEEIARVTVVFDNQKRNGERPIPTSTSDEYHLSRYIKRDGNYWHEVNQTSVAKSEVEGILSRLGIDPNNMLLIMHQNMVEEFSAVDPPEKLRMVEEAVGLGSLREKVLKARENLESILEDEEEATDLLGDARNNLSHWDEKMERYRRKQRLRSELSDLDLELAWKRVSLKESEVDRKERDVEKLSSRVEETSERVGKWTERAKERRRGLRRQDLRLKEYYDDGDEGEEGEGLQELSGIIDERWDLLESYVEARERKAVQEFKRGLLRERLQTQKEELRELEGELEDLRASASERGERVPSRRTVKEVEEDIRLKKYKLADLRDVSEEAVEMYERYVEEVDRLEERVEVARENKERALEEISLRERKWRKKLRELTSSVDERYRDLLRSIGAVGSVRLTDIDEIEEAGIELLVGFGGTEPRVLDAYTQSGGERTSSVMCFLLALQQFVTSPIRAVDEFDVHMDPRNRMAVMEEILDSAQGEGSQYVVITPSYVDEMQEASNLIFVQKVNGASRPRLAG